MVEGQIETSENLGVDGELDRPSSRPPLKTHKVHVTHIYRVRPNSLIHQLLCHSLNIEHQRGVVPLNGITFRAFGQQVPANRV